MWFTEENRIGNRCKNCGAMSLKMGDLGHFRTFYDLILEPFDGWFFRPPFRIRMHVDRRHSTSLFTLVNSHSCKYLRIFHGT